MKFRNLSFVNTCGKPRVKQDNEQNAKNMKDYLKDREIAILKDKKEKKG